MYFLDYDSPPLTPNSLGEILDLCFQQSEYFSLTLHRLPWKTNELQVELAPYLHSERKTARWFSYGTMEYDPLEIFLYSANYNTKAIVAKYYHGLFLDNLSANTLEWKQGFEDLCFFSNNKLIFGTVSHEAICRVYPPNKDFETRLLSIYRHWKTEDDDGEQISLSEYIKT